MSVACVAWLQREFRYLPRDPALFLRALTHRSAAAANNERLEFLGDAVLNLVAADELYRRFPRADEGVLSRLRAGVVNGEALARVAAGLRLGEVVALGAGELKTGGFRRESILADAFEAVCGALYLDAGLEVARPLLLQVMQPLFEALEVADVSKDAKTRLQEWLQGRGLPLPRYTLERVTGESHEQHFTMRCELDSPPAAAVGEGSSRRRAEQRAAQKVLEQVIQ
jgi:ribonuclease-3